MPPTKEEEEEEEEEGGGGENEVAVAAGEVGNGATFLDHRAWCRTKMDQNLNLGFSSFFHKLRHLMQCRPECRSVCWAYVAVSGGTYQGNLTVQI